MVVAKSIAIVDTDVCVKYFTYNQATAVADWLQYLLGQ